MHSDRYTAQYDHLDVAPEGTGLPLDAGIARFVRILAGNGVETYESCEGGPGHCSAEPFVKFSGEPGAGLHAVSVAMAFGLPWREVRRVWSRINGELSGPTWEMTFSELADGRRVALWWFDVPPSALATAEGTR